MIEYNMYCDESCHLENDDSSIMVLGSVYCPKNKLKEINKRIKEIKQKHDIIETVELKWTKVSESKVQVYLDLIDYFLDDDDLSFRCIIADKTKLNHAKYNQTHDEWYYKMYFQMLKTVFDPENIYTIYVDIKDTHSYEKCQKLLTVCRNSRYDFSGKIIKKIQPIRSNEIQIMQLTDILIGAIGYANRFELSSNKRNKGKIAIINRLRDRTRYSLKKSTLSRENKLNLFKWEPNYYESH